MRPPCISTIRLAIASPKPGATLGLVDELSTCWNSSKIFWRPPRGFPDRCRLTETTNIPSGSVTRTATFACIRELYRIAHEIQQHLGDAPLVTIGDRQTGGTSTSSGAFLGGQGPDRSGDTLSHVVKGVIAQRKHELSCFDLGKVEHIVDEAKQMASALLYALEHVADFLGHLAVDPVDDQLRVAENGVERRAQLVAHVGEELRLVLARDLQARGSSARFPETAVRSGSPARTGWRTWSADRPPCCGNSPGCVRVTVRAPITWSSRMSGTASTARNPLSISHVTHATLVRVLGGNVRDLNRLALRDCLGRSPLRPFLRGSRLKASATSCV